MKDDNQLMVLEPGPLHAQAKKVAGACKAIVLKTGVKIDKRIHVKVEGWQAIANGFNCTASSKDVVEVVDSDGTFRGFKAIGVVTRNSDGRQISEAEGFVGVDEPRWFGGKMKVWDYDKREKVTKEFDSAPEYSQRAMAQTRAISRACRSAFAFVVVMIDEKLDTTPAEEMPEHGDPTEGREKVVTGREADDDRGTGSGRETASGTTKPKRWQEVTCTFGKKDGPLRGKLLGELDDRNLTFLSQKFIGEMRPEDVENKDKAMVAALQRWLEERQEDRR